MKIEARAQSVRQTSKSSILRRIHDIRIYLVHVVLLHQVVEYEVQLVQHVYDLCANTRGRSGAKHKRDYSRGSDPYCSDPPLDPLSSSCTPSGTNQLRELVFHKGLPRRIDRPYSTPYPSPESHGTVREAASA